MRGSFFFGLLAAVALLPGAALAQDEGSDEARWRGNIRGEVQIGAGGPAPAQVAPPRQRFERPAPPIDQPRVQPPQQLPPQLQEARREFQGQRGDGGGGFRRDNGGGGGFGGDGFRGGGFRGGNGGAGFGGGNGGGDFNRRQQQYQPPVLVQPGAPVDRGARGDFRQGGGFGGNGGVPVAQDRRDFRDDRRDNRQDFRGDRRDDRRDFRGGRFDNRQGFRTDRFDNRQDFRRDRFDNRQDFRGDRFDNRQGFRGDRFDNRQDFRGDRRGFQQFYRPDWRQNGRGWNRDWRRDNRWNWQSYRSYNRDIFRLPRYYAPYGWNYGYRRFTIGYTLNALLFDQRYWIDDPYNYRLPYADYPFEWVRYYNDALLVDVETGEVVDVVYDIFY